MKVLVTGATGYIGNKIITKLINRGIEVVATSSDEDKASQFAWYKQVRFVEYNILDDTKADLFEKFERPDKLLHLAWGGLPNYYNISHLEIEYPAHYKFIKSLVNQGLTDVNVLGTCLEYGLQEGELDPMQMTRPTTAYGLAKDFLRSSIELLNKTNSFSFKWMRLFYIYSEDQPRNSIYPSLISKIKLNEPVFNMSKGNQIRDFIEANEAIEQIISICFSNEKFLLVNICSESPVTVMEFVKATIEKSGANIKLNPGYYSYNDYEPMYFWGKKHKFLKK